MASKKLQDFALAAGAKVEGEQIIFSDEWQLERCMNLAVARTFEAQRDEIETQVEGLAGAKGGA